ncbi:MAG: DUF4279 domain-containing protein [Propionibacteriaceae bacterium]|jgi:hypothetical protein|nr:DUF4279 domain-containing protein [Propionibacteriaceae bacterium]
MIEIRSELAITGSQIDFHALRERTGIDGETRDARRLWGTQGCYYEALWRIEAAMQGTSVHPTDSDPSWQYPAVSLPTEELFALLSDRIEGIGDYCRTNSLEVYLTEIVRSSGDALPIMEFSPALLHKIGVIGATLQFDIYLNAEK